ncbi:AmpG family muropeptide MFS transporter [Rhodoferax sp.]|uniref:AmpG family muropeptide MFS transporter n=1 Tax=Rhodoferax sp. TaxID=50421 RepID=UPI002769C82D|nr:AmpG family muropeptide MFS transporter [Rhodoferax sp.]
MMVSAGRARSPWAWVPTLYFAQGIPYVVVMTLSVIMYKNLGIDNTDIALYTSWLYMPWVIKPLWSPLMELFGTKRAWIVALQFAVGAALACVALTIPGPDFFRMTLAVLWLMAFSSASHDIAADGFYMLALPEHNQAAFVGVRSAFYRLANIGGQGGLVYLAGVLQERTGSMQTAWSVVFYVLTALFVAMALFHWRMLPRPLSDTRGPGAGKARDLVHEFFAVFGTFFKKPGILVVLGFLLLYRFPEAQLLKLATPFLLDKPELGGLGLSTKAVGIAYGTVGLLALTCGGLLGGWIISRFGLKRVVWPLVLLMHVPNAVFVFLALAQPQDVVIVSAALAVEQFGYGLGFTAYMMYMILVADGPHKTAHYAICTGFMALGMMLPGMWSGWLQQQLGYLSFFVWVMLATLPSFAMVALIKIPEGFGKKAEQE